MFRGFFKSKKWQNRLISASVTSLGSGLISSMQDADYINPRRLGMPIGIGAVAGSLADSYLQEGKLTIPTPGNVNLATVITFLNTGLTLLVTPLFEGDNEKAKAWTGMTLSCLFLGLAACIQPQPSVRQENQPQQDNSTESAVPSYRARRYRNSTVS